MRWGGKICVKRNHKLPHVNGEVPAQRGMGHLEHGEARRGIARGAPPALRATSPLRWGGYAPNRGKAGEGPDCHVDLAFGSVSSQ